MTETKEKLFLQLAKILSETVRHNNLKIWEAEMKYEEYEGDNLAFD